MDKREIYETENLEWLDSLEYIIKNENSDRVRELLNLLQTRAMKYGIDSTPESNTPYINTILPEDEIPFTGDLDTELKIENLIRWNAMALVVRANLESEGIGGHIATYSSAATLIEVGFNHFFRGESDDQGADLIFFQGHASPGIYARSFLEGRLTLQSMNNFRQELRKGGGLPSYPHPRLMPDYWQFPTVSMGLSPMLAIYQARFIKHMENRRLKNKSNQKIWAFLGDGEMDEPESMGALTVASREKLDNLIFVVNCNLQRLDGPVRPNGKIIQELESLFLGAGWNVIKVIWGKEWDALLQKDQSGELVKAMNETPDGQFQKYVVSTCEYFRKDFFGRSKKLQELVKDYSDEQLQNLTRGGHDPIKVFNAYKVAMQSKGKPTVILAQTIKGYGLGEAGEGKNITHQQKKLKEQQLLDFRNRFDLPLSDDKAKTAAFFKPTKDSKELTYLKKRRKTLGGFLPMRKHNAEALKAPENSVYKELLEGSGKREYATTMALVQLMGKLLGDKNIGQHIVPIVPDESRTFGMDALYRQVGIYSHVGQNYEPVDKDSLLYYKEAIDGVILDEGISEAGCMSSFIAAGTAYSTLNTNMVPIYLFYSMFGFQRVGDFIWAATDARARGFLIGATSGRTTLPGEGLQHLDGQSHLSALSIPSLRAYDPAFAFELAVIVKEGIQRMFIDQEDLMYYITVINEKYPMPKMPKNSEEGILKGMYKFRKTPKKNGLKVHLLGSGSILNEALRAAQLLEKKFDIGADVWSVTSYKALYDDAREVERWNRLNPEKKSKKTYIQQCFEGDEELCVAAHDYVKAIPLTVGHWFPETLTVLGTDGFGPSDNRRALRNHFEVDDKHITYAALHSLHIHKKLEKETLLQAIKQLKISADKSNPSKH